MEAGNGRGRRHRGCGGRSTARPHILSEGQGRQELAVLATVGRDHTPAEPLSGWSPHPQPRLIPWIRISGTAPPYAGWISESCTLAPWLLPKRQARADPGVLPGPSDPGASRLFTRPGLQGMQPADASGSSIRPRVAGRSQPQLPGDTRKLRNEPVYIVFALMLPRVYFQSGGRTMHSRLLNPDTMSCEPAVLPRLLPGFEGSAGGGGCSGLPGPARGHRGPSYGMD